MKIYTMKWNKRSFILPCGIAVCMIQSFTGKADSQQRMGTMTWAGSGTEWVAVNDGVMGGISRGRAALTERNTLLFTGEVSFENNGGFASIRHDAMPFGITEGSGVRLRVKGDGKTYQFRVSTANGFGEINYKCTFSTVKDEWLHVEMRWEEFIATYRGRIIPDAPELRGSDIRRIGFLIADRQEGSFALEVESIEPL